MYSIEIAEKIKKKGGTCHHIRSHEIVQLYIVATHNGRTAAGIHRTIEMPNHPNKSQNATSGPDHALDVTDCHGYGIENVVMAPRSTKYTPESDGMVAKISM